MAAEWRPYDEGLTYEALARLVDLLCESPTLVGVPAAPEPEPLVVPRVGPFAVPHPRRGPSRRIQND